MCLMEWITMEKSVFPSVSVCVLECACVLGSLTEEGSLCVCVNTFRGSAVPDLLRRVGEPRVPSDKIRPQTHFYDILRSFNREITIWLNRWLVYCGRQLRSESQAEEYKSLVFLSLQGLQSGEAFG